MVLREWETEKAMSIDHLMNRDPLELSAADIDEMIAYNNRLVEKARAAGAAKDLAGKAAEDFARAAKGKVDVVSVLMTPAFVEKIRAHPEGVKVLVKGADGTVFEAPLSVWVQTALFEKGKGYEFPEDCHPLWWKTAG
jgi:hypothetical protein